MEGLDRRRHPRSLPLQDRRDPDAAAQQQRAKKMAFDFLNVALAPNSQQFFNVPEVIRQVAKTFTDVFPNVDAFATRGGEPGRGNPRHDERPGSPGRTVAPHAEHLVLERTMQISGLRAHAPEAQALIQQHAMQHQQLLQQTARGSGSPRPA